MSLSLATGLVVALAATPVAAKGPTQVSGMLTPDTAGVCTEDAASVATYTVTGNLTGCWYIDEWIIRNETPSRSIQAYGTEVFSGCLDGPVAALLDDVHLYLQGGRRRGDPRPMPSSDRGR